MGKKKKEVPKMVGIRLPESQIRELKIAAVLMDMPMQEIVTAALMNWLANLPLAVRRQINATNTTIQNMKMVDK